MKPFGNHLRQRLNTEFKWDQIVHCNDALPNGTLSHTLVVHKDRFYVFGGFDSSWHNTLFSFKFGEGWRQITTKNAPSARAGQTAVVIKDSMYIFGGYCNDEYLDDLHVFDFIKQEWSYINPESLSRPACRSLQSAVPYEMCFIMYGGFNKHRNHYFNEAWEYNSITTSWRILNCSGDIPEGGRYGHGAAIVLDHQMFVFGGSCESGLSNDMLCLNLLTNQWKKIVQKGAIPIESSYFSVVSSYDTILWFGGYSEKLRNFMNEVYVFDVITKTWKKIEMNGKKPPVRCFHQAVKYGNKMLVYGGQGASNLQEYLNDLWMIEIWRPVNFENNFYIKILQNCRFGDINFIK